MINGFSKFRSYGMRAVSIPCLFLVGIFFLQVFGAGFVSFSWAQGSDKYPLHEAVRIDDIEAARRLLAEGEKHLALDVDDQGMLPLQIAVSTGSIKMVRILIDEYNVDPNHIADSGFSSKSRGRSPLHLAAAAGKLSIVDFLLDSDANIFAVDIGGISALHLAIQYGHSSVADKLIKKMGKRAHIRDKNATTPLHVAARHGQDAITSRLLFLGGGHTGSENAEGESFIDAKNNFGLTPLHYAAAWGHGGVIKLLLSDGANVNVANKQGLTPLFLASRDGREEVVALLSAQQGVNLERGDDEAHTPLCVAVANGHLRIFARLLSRGADPHAKDKNGMIPLHIASKRGNFEAVTSLLQTKGGNINERDNNGNTPLHYAAEVGHMGLVESLLQSGADVSARNIKNETAGDLARASGHNQILQILHH